MPKHELSNYDLKILRLANTRKYIRRGILGWPMGSTHRSIEIQHLIDVGYVKFFYDWGFDCPCLKITGLGRARLVEEDGADRWEQAA